MKRVIARLAAFVRGSYPPLVSTVFAVAWACGVTGLVAAVDRRASWRPGTGTLVAALTLVVDLLLMRAIDDIRDLDYDRAHNPGRPLPAAAVGVGDLLVLYAAGAAVVLAVNASNGAGMVLLAVQLGYALALLAADRLGRTPGGDHPLANLALGFPAQLLVHLYLYACYLRATRLPPDARGCSRCSWCCW